MNLDDQDPSAPRPNALDPTHDAAGDLRLEPTPPPPERPKRTGLWVAGGLGLVLAAVLALGVLLTGGELPDMAPAGAKTLDIQLAESAVAPVTPLSPGAPLDVLPDDMAEAAPHNPPLIPEPPPAVERAEGPPAPALPWDPDALRQPANMVVPPSFDCRRARSRAERVVCADPFLAEADQRLAAAYEQALAAGVADWRLERQQRRWLRAREDAAMDAPAAVAEVYAARIAELEAQADLPPPEAPPWPPSW
ncbi:MAG: hypothetical protein Q7V15_10605 [Phenylobacterium sp.]|uniref:hypothetical protein n=1 Tax=Phenylobacterium sp. TaxID=1871053 RepID=UPI002723BF5A|nr:hypothetical protein [Phenylobacterium sp.]MDO8901795.1 hypothetical protein [Phenylobacterium sp.]MDP2215264.1 hypothetical protein [Phenylobacterium sp.]